MENSDWITKAERREQKLQNKHKMKVTGRGNRLLQQIIIEKSRKKNG